MPRRPPATPRSPGLFARLGLAFKAAMRQMAFPQFGGGYGADSGFGSGLGWLGWLGGENTTPYDYTNQSGNPYHNVAVAACLRVIRENVGEPTIRVVEPQEDGDEVPVPRSAAADLIRKPNPRYNGKKLLGWMMTSAEVDGNGFAIKIRATAGIPVQIWQVPPWTMVPRWDEGDPSSEIEWWEYRPGGTRTYRVEDEDVIWFKVGEPDASRYGGRLYSSPLRQAAARTICSLNEVESFTANILLHGGVPPIAIEPTSPEGPYPDDSDAERMTQSYRSLRDAERRGDPYIATGPFNVKVLGYSPEQLSLKSIPDRLEDMICAMTGVPPMLAGLSSGGARQTFANYAEARRSFYEDKLQPSLKDLLEAFTESLRLDPGMFDGDDQYLAADWGDVAALRDDQQQLATIATTLYEKGVFTRAQALRMVGQDASKDDELYIVGRGMQFLRVGEKVPPFQAIMPTPGNPNLPPGEGGGVATPGDDNPVDGEAKPGADAKPAEPKPEPDAKPGPTPAKKDAATPGSMDAKNCGTGHGGFQPGNTCQGHGGGGHGGGGGGGSHSDSGSSSSSSSLGFMTGNGRQFSDTSSAVTTKNKEDMVAYQEKNYGDWAKSLSEKESAALGEYTGGDYKAINKQLRAGTPKGAVKAQVASLDGALNKAAAPEDLVAFRGIRDLKAVTGVDTGNASSLVGATIRDNGYLSMSLNRTVASRPTYAAGADKGATLVVSIPKGSRVAGMEPVTRVAHPGYSGVGGEHEMLAARGHGMKINHVTRDASGRAILYAELVPPAANQGN